MNIYTKTGDKGETSIIGGRVFKNDLRVEAYGTLDELNSFVGHAAALAKQHIQCESITKQLIEIMHELFDCGADLAYADPSKKQYKVDQQLVLKLEQWIDEYVAEAPPLTKFILPGGSELASVLHICRTVCRRAERHIVTLAHRTPINDDVLTYVNRLSDYFFAVARVANVRLHVSDVEYVRSADVFR